MDDFRLTIGEVANQLDLIPVYADDELGEGHILTNKIFRLIDNADICFFEISETERPNVFIELGYS